MFKNSSIYCNAISSLWFHSWDGAPDFSNDIVNSNDFKSFKHKAKLLKKHTCICSKRVLGDATIALSLQYLCDFWKSLEMLLNNFKLF